MSISAMKQALEALEKLWDIIDDIDTYSDMAKNDDKLYRSLVERRQRQRFEQTGISTDGYELNGGAITALRQAIAEAEKQEAVAWMWKDGTLTSDPDFADGTWTPLFTAPVYPSDILQEPVDETEKREHEPWCDSVTKLLLSMPPQIPPCNCKPKREWVGLTDEEIHEVVSKKWWDWEDAFDIEGFSRAIEAKLKEKNT